VWLCSISQIWPAFVHDSRIFWDLFTLFECGEEKIYQAHCITYNYAYPNRTEFFLYTGDYSRILPGDRCFMTPFPDQLQCHSSQDKGTQWVNFSQLKCLKSLRVAPDRACDIAWAILHNIAPSENFFCRACADTLIGCTGLLQSSPALGLRSTTNSPSVSPTGWLVVDSK